MFAVALSVAAPKWGQPGRRVDRPMKELVRWGPSSQENIVWPWKRTKCRHIAPRGWTSATLLLSERSQARQVTAHDSAYMECWEEEDP